jgi:hypothetical protein
VYPTFQIAEGMYKTGEDLVAAIKAAITAAPVSWNNGGAAGNVLNFAATAAQPSPLGNILFKYSGAAPAGTPLIFIDTIFQQNGVQYDSSRLFGTTHATITFTHAGGQAVPVALVQLLFFLDLRNASGACHDAVFRLTLILWGYFIQSGIAGGTTEFAVSTATVCQELFRFHVGNFAAS